MHAPPPRQYMSPALSRDPAGGLPSPDPLFCPLSKFNISIVEIKSEIRQVPLFPSGGLGVVISVFVL